MEEYLELDWTNDFCRDSSCLINIIDVLVAMTYRHWSSEQCACWWKENRGFAYLELW